jgi:dephospho-CoA kinase
MRRVALTGGIATGKSTVLRRLKRRGIPTIDADRLAREVVRPGEAALDAIRVRFGRGVLADDGTLDRRALADIVFADPEARAALEAIVHPAVYAAIDRWFAQLAATAPAGVADIPLLYESGHAGDFDLVVVAACEPELQMARLMTRDKLTADDARRRIAAQWPIAEKVRRADRVIRTDGTIAETEAQVDRLAAELAGGG